MPNLKGILGMYNPDSSTAENMRELLLAIDEGDLPVLIENELDRIRSKPTKKSAKLALEVLAPLASRLNMQSAKRDLENLGFETLYPEQYRLVMKLLRAKNADTEKEQLKFVAELERKLALAGIKSPKISGRTKQPYSLYKKLNKAGTIEDIHDLIAVRVLADDEASCYHILDLVHQEYVPNLERFKDYIKNPKENGYQSLHTTVTSRAKTYEIQIRTHAMHELAESGQAAHWYYDEHKSTKDYRRGKAADAKDLEQLDCVYVFSPQGDVYKLRSPATALDFAYAVHSSVGERTKSIKVNGSIVPLDARLSSGDQVSVLTGKEGKPKRDWLRFVTSKKARNRIQSKIRVEESERYLRVGRELLHDSFTGKIPDLSMAVEEFNKASADELVEAVGRGEVTVHAIKRLLAPPEEVPTASSERGAKTAALPVDIAGVSGLQYRFASCCSPSPPDKIVGYITRSLGITVHKQGCSQAKGEPSRLVKCTWRKKKD